MNEWTTIRRKVLVEKASKRSVCAEFGVGWRTLAKILAHPSSAGLPAQRTPDQTQARAVPVGHRPDPRRRQGRPGQAAPHGQADLRAAARRVRLHGRDHPGDRDGGPGPPAQQGGLRPAQPPAGPRPIRLRRGGGDHRRRADEGSALGHDAAVFRCLSRLGLSKGVHRELPGGSRGRLRLLRRRAGAHQLRQLKDRREEGGRRRA